MVEIRAECNKVLQENRIFNTKLRRGMKVEEFKQHQSSSRTSLQTATGAIGWCDKLTKIIKASFKDVGKGWFNLNVTEDEQESYEFGKLKKFLSLVNFMMQDTVLNLCKNSVYEFVDYMKDFIPDETLITSAAQVENKFPKKKRAGDDSDETDEDESDGDLPIAEDELEWAKAIKRQINKEFCRTKNPEPLFQLDLIRKANQLVPGYNNNPTEIVAKIKGVFEDGVKCLQDIPHLEPMLLKQLFKTQTVKAIKTPVIPPEKPLPPDPNDKTKFLDENAWLWEAFHEDLIVHLERAIVPLNEYKETYRAFAAENDLDPDKYVAKFAEVEEGQTPATPQAIRDDIRKQEQAEAGLLERIPSEI
jgi:dynein heavy chain